MTTMPLGVANYVIIYAFIGQYFYIYIHVCGYIYIYIYIYMCVCVCVCLWICIAMGEDQLLLMHPPSFIKDTLLAAALTLSTPNMYIILDCLGIHAYASNDGWKHGT